jgi:hypothetical protein
MNIPAFQDRGSATGKFYRYPAWQPRAQGMTKRKLSLNSDIDGQALFSMEEIPMRLGMLRTKRLAK